MKFALLLLIAISGIVATGFQVGEMTSTAAVYKLRLSADRFVNDEVTGTWEESIDQEIGKGFQLKFPIFNTFAAYTLKVSLEKDEVVIELIGDIRGHEQGRCKDETRFHPSGKNMIALFCISQYQDDRILFQLRGEYQSLPPVQ